MKFSSFIYNVTPIYEFLEYVAAKQFPAGVTANDLMNTISASNNVSFGDAIDTILSAQNVCYILNCEVPEDVDSDMLIGLGS